ncbi:putative c6 finger domain protein [Neofusicoccum parvum UCRNP2]|uniref:Putative c6 finger domain protein n=1 Tax=Botryosphaeria parva (strain UCR-NP2) TaxID=1287680 RepID=R1EXP6_BOTPV|nr:putative c6 finger domain protein [Neofusicoccum parvum UCRNP2]
MADQKDQRASSDAPQSASNSNNSTTPQASAKPNAKDPLRPRRKKARRACFACQRAHLTCGDERPCQRCIKRGLQDACHDGVRKKAKYLHDAPPEALMPGVGGHYPHLSNACQPGAASVPNSAPAMGQPNNFYPQAQQANYNVYPNSSQGQMPPPMQEASAMNSFNNQQSPISPQYNQNNQQTSPVQSMGSIQQNQPSNHSGMQDFGGIPFDPSDPALFNFDLASLNFGNHYGALDEIYDSVTSPYPYTDGFHGLIALLKQRFSITKRSRIAKALASIRPSFIACTSTLNTDDLVFMEKSFQRTLYQYEDFINAHAVPTIICRRTGQIAAVSQEFSLLTGWKKDVLLGYEPNQNVNTGGSTTRSCKLIRYRTKEDLSALENMNIKSEESGTGIKDHIGRNKAGSIFTNGNTVVKLEGGAGAGRPGDKDGLINCMFCWSVKRDVFEVPMLIVMNFLPIME